MAAGKRNHGETLKAYHSRLNDEAYKLRHKLAGTYLSGNRAGMSVHDSQVQSKMSNMFWHRNNMLRGQQFFRNGC